MSAAEPAGRAGLPRVLTIERLIALVALVVVVVWPWTFSAYWAGQILTQVFFMGIVAASISFLSAYAGMVSFGQVAIYGIAGFVYGNATTHGGTKGLNLGYSPWLGIVLALVFALVFALLFGALASRSSGIYFLMITLTFGVIANLFFAEVAKFSGFGGISGVVPPSPLASGQQAAAKPLYYTALVAALLVYAFIRYVVRTPFGLALQGVRDDPVRMSSLGFNVPLVRTAAFALAGLFAAIGGLFFVWWNGHIDPASIDLGTNINALLIAVVGGLSRVEGAWVGALFYYAINNVIQTYLPNGIPSIGGTFNTIIGLAFLLVVVVSPDGLTGIWRMGADFVRRRRTEPAAAGGSTGAGA